jgi:multidrug resistance protein, MATE family
VGIATMISYSFNFIMITVICKTIKELKKSFFFITKESIQEGISDFLKIGVPSAAMLCLEWGGLEILALIASAISVDATGAQIIALNFFIVVLMIPFGG